jgi:hypothetical protein
MSIESRLHYGIYRSMNDREHLKTVCATAGIQLAELLK